MGVVYIYRSGIVFKGGAVTNVRFRQLTQLLDF
jgi:hypothetical protein